jgi:hypothetical protein
VFSSGLKRIRGDLAALSPRWLRRLSTAQRKALAFTLISLIGWSVWNGFRTFDHPWGDLSHGNFTDHFSHMNAARVFPRMGRDVWRVPIADKFRRLTPSELEKTPSDVQKGASGTGGVFFVPGWPADKPLTISWSDKTRMYPPGDMLLVAPIAALYHYTSLSLSGACRMLLGWFLVLSHVALFFFFLTYFEGKGTGIDWLACFFVYSQVINYTLEGFYDPVAIVPLVLCARYLGRGRGLAAGVAYCAGAMLHFRVFFQAPWALFAAGVMIRKKFWRHFQLRDGVAMTVAALCAVVSLYVFWLDWASLGHVGINNSYRLSWVAQNKAGIWTLKIVLVACALALLTARAWFDLVSLAWLAIVIFTLREAYFWHLLISLSWIAAPARRPMVRGVRLAFLLFATATVFSGSIVPSWLTLLYHAN